MGVLAHPLIRLVIKMVLEDGTFEKCGYYPSDLKQHSKKPILAACDGCGKVRETTKDRYYALCRSCSQKGNTNSSGHIVTEETRAKLSAANLGKKRTKETKSKIRAANKGKTLTEETKSKISAATKGEKSPHWKGGKKLALARRRANRRKLGYTLIMPLQKGEQGHHITNEYVIGIPAKVHQSMSSNNRKKHRTLVLQWLKVNDKKKYKKALCVLANTSNPSRL